MSIGDINNRHTSSPLVVISSELFCANRGLAATRYHGSTYGDLTRVLNIGARAGVARPIDISSRRIDMSSMKIEYCIFVYIILYVWHGLITQKSVSLNF